MRSILHLGIFLSAIFAAAPATSAAGHVAAGHVAAGHVAAGQEPGAVLSPWLRQLYRRSQPAGAFAGGQAGAQAWAAASSPLFHVDGALLAAGRVRVQLDTGPGGAAAVTLRPACESAIPELAWEGARGRIAQVTLPIPALPCLGEVAGLDCAMRPPTGLPLEETSEGVGAMGAPALHVQGADGRGVKIGILDVGFAGATGPAGLIGRELPSDTRWRAFAGSTSGNGDLANGTSHGTACAEIVHDVAPGAQLYLANAETVTELQAAIRWLREEGVSVISHSVGWFWGPGDGTGDIVSVVQEAIDEEVLWVNAVGNQALSFYGGAFVDDDGDGRHEFDAAGDESLSDTQVPRSREYIYVLTWDRWPYSHDLAFEMDLYENGQRVATSDQATTPAGYAYRELFYTTQSAAAEVDLVIRRKTGTGDARLRLFRLDNHGYLSEHATAAGSYVIPADAEDVLSVGAYYLDDDEPALEPFSSYGPTLGGLGKPEICALDRVTTATSAPFQGTSAACPHVAGAAAVLYSASPPGGFFDFRWSRRDLLGILEGSADPRDLGPADATGWGLLRMPTAAAGGAAARDAALSASSPSTGLVHLRWDPRGIRAVHARAGGETFFEVFDATGRRVHRARADRDALGGGAWTWRARASSGEPLPAGLYLLRLSGPGWESSARTLLLR